MKRILIFTTLLAGVMTLPSCTAANGLIESVERSVNRAAGALR